MNTFKDIPQIRYEGANSKNPFSFKFYDAERQIGGKAMKEHLKFAMSWWHTLCAAGTDPFGDDTIERTYGQKDLMNRAKARTDAGFELMEKLGIDYFCFHDADVAPRGRDFAETAPIPDTCTAQAPPAMRTPMPMPRRKSKMRWTRRFS